MGIRSGFFMSENGDRTYKAEFFAEYFASFIGNGVFPTPSNNLQIIANNDMSVTVKKGSAWINGYVAFNDNDYILQLDPADGVLNRIDRIVLRWDLIGRKIKLEVKKGEFASQPVAKELQRNADAYELALADVRVNNGVISITQSAITDTRLDTDLCGVVHGVVEQVDTTTLFNQYETAFGEDRVQFQQEFDKFIGQLEGALGEDVAGSLLLQITELQNNKADKTYVEEEIGKIDLSDLDNHIAVDDSEKHKATQISLADTKFTATDVETGMGELFTNVSNGKDLVSGAITGVDDSVVIPTEPSFSDLAGAIGGISTGKKWVEGSFDGVFRETEYTYEIIDTGFVPSYVIFSYSLEVSGYTWVDVYSAVINPENGKDWFRCVGMSYTGDSYVFSAGKPSSKMPITIAIRGSNERAIKDISWIAFE